MPNLLNRTTISKSSRRGLPIGNGPKSSSKKTRRAPKGNISWPITNSLIGARQSFRNSRAMQHPYSRKSKIFNLRTAQLAQLLSKLSIGEKEAWFQKSPTRTSVAQIGLLLPLAPSRVLSVSITVNSRPCRPNSSSIARAQAVDVRVV